MRRPASLARRAIDRRRTRRQRNDDFLMHIAFIVILLEEEEAAAVMASRGSKAGKKNLPRVRKSIDAMLTELGNYVRRAYRMTLEAFLELHDALAPALLAKFRTGSADTAPTGPNGGFICTKLRLSAAIRFFAGAEVWDLMSSHGIGRSTIYDSIWKVVDAVNESSQLSFNEDNSPFPTHAEQEEIADGFGAKSGAGFNKVVGAIDGMLIWTVCPPLKWCREKNKCQTNFHCSRKDKYGLVMLAICDHRTKFRWLNISEPGRMSDYASWIKTDLTSQLDDDALMSQILLAGHTLIGDNAFVKKKYMAVPFPGTGIEVSQDAYNFYLSQLRITIERAFGILVHRWGVLRKPLNVHIGRVSALVTCLCRLHNYCIDSGLPALSRTSEEDERSIHRVARQRSAQRGGTRMAAINLDRHARPDGLLDGGDHFSDCEGRGRGRPAAAEAETPMDGMLRQVQEQGLVRPPIQRRT